jgi:AmmeMemoRadiSam system protein B
MAYRRPPAFAGLFYPEQPEELRSTVERALQEARALPCRATAVIVPHAGYRYSGSVAAAGYAALAPDRCRALRQVILLGTAHSPDAAGLVTSRAEAFVTPLGPVFLDRSAVERVLDLPQVTVDEEQHACDHALEVQLPFLQVLLPEATIVPFLVGPTEAREVEEVLERLWRTEESLIVISSDLSHYHDAETASAVDRRTAQAIAALQVSELGPSQACGFAAIRGLLSFADRRGWRVAVADLKNSGDTGGPLDRVVGYGAFVFAPGAAP